KQDSAKRHGGLWQKNSSEHTNGAGDPEKGRWERQKGFVGCKTNDETLDRTQELWKRTNTAAGVRSLLTAPTLANTGIVSAKEPECKKESGETGFCSNAVHIAGTEKDSRRNRSPSTW
ncbi:MAG: uncharacterized protein A8A55_3477, partial [Amphiamblys sp. WSBS2006]